MSTEKNVSVLVVYNKNASKKDRDYHLDRIHNNLTNFSVRFTEISSDEFLQDKDFGIDFKLLSFHGSVFEDDYDYTKIEKAFDIITSRYHAITPIALSKNKMKLIKAETLGISTYLSPVYQIEGVTHIVREFWIEMNILLENNLHVNIVDLRAKAIFENRVKQIEANVEDQAVSIDYSNDEILDSPIAESKAGNYIDRKLEENRLKMQRMNTRGRIYIGLIIATIIIAISTIIYYINW